MDILAKSKEQDYTGPGKLQTGFLMGSIKNIGTTEAIVNGVPLSPGEAKGYPFVGKGYEAIDFDPNQSTLRVLEIS
ncbi:hypothetical protein [Aquimarina agarivorans]|uniref:hypothetical protein n=1 Tax=Aquimarina agarivorans TaxID=980584 RepID=UPI000248FC4F|nr:hypothetical protein [Aquimarina agarivorans]